MIDNTEKHQSDDHHEHSVMTERVEVAQPGAPVVSAEITSDEGPHGTAVVGLHTSRSSADGTHRELVDQVMAHPGVADSDKVHVVAALGDAETITRLQEHTENFQARAAGASTVIDADLGSAAAHDVGD